MRIKSLLAVLTLVAGFATHTSTASAVDVSASLGDFVVNISPASVVEGKMPDCTPSIVEIGMQLMSGSTSVTASCVVNNKSASATLSGSASNASLVTSTGDSGFSNGTISATCSTDDTVNLNLTLSRTDTTLNTFSGVTFEACSFAMTFTDKKASSLVGTIEVNGKLGSADGSVANNVASVDITASVYVTQGTGIFAGYAGGGDFEQTQSIDLSAGRTGGGTGGGGTGGGNDALQTFCTAHNVTPCTQEGLQTFCSNPDNFAACSTLQPQSVSGTALRVRSASVRASATSNASTMRLTLSKSTGKPRVLSPAPAPGNPTAAAKVGAKTKIVIAAVTGSKCTVKTNKGKVVGTATSSGKFGRATVTPKSGAYKGASSIVASCKKGSKTVTSSKVKIKLS